MGALALASSEVQFRFLSAAVGSVGAQIASPPWSVGGLLQGEGCQGKGQLVTLREGPRSGSNDAQSMTVSSLGTFQKGGIYGLP